MSNFSGMIDRMQLPKWQTSRLIDMLGAIERAEDRGSISKFMRSLRINIKGVLRLRGIDYDAMKKQIRRDN